MNTRIQSSSILLFAVAVWAGFLFVRATGPDDLYGRDQIKVAGYVLDIVENDAWLWQEDHEGNFASKPPLTQWLGALATEAYGKFHRLTLTFPSWLASLITIFLLVGWTAEQFGRTAAMWVPLMLLANNMGLRQILLARSDTLFQCSIVLLALGAWHAWIDRGKWGWIFVGSLAALMTKGPLGILIGLLGLFAVFLRRREDSSEASRESTPSLPWKGIALAIVLACILPAAWLYTANADSGGRAIEKLLHEELIAHSVGERTAENQQVWWHHLLPIAWFLSRLAPAGLFATAALIRIWRKPAVDHRQRNAELFLASWLIGGLFLLCLASHHRFVHLLAILPPAAVLAAQQISMWWSSERRSWMWALVTCSSILPLAAVYLDVIDYHSRDIVSTRESAIFTEAVIEEAGAGARFEFFRCHPGIQVHLASHRDSVAINDLSATLESESPLYLITAAEKELKERATLQGVQFFDIAVRSDFGDSEVILLASKGASGANRPISSRRPALMILTLLSITTAMATYGAHKYALSRLNG
ncbi:MAG: hypothetical protein CBC13_10525 [Planctomycetia bacterium TMED53]|nr:MAG: hypothetical protein CBC13_10525 [Planctomycetia bacterium TMED53]